MTWRPLDAPFPDTREEDYTIRVGDQQWEFRRIGKTSFLRIDGAGPVLELPGLAKFTGLFAEPDLATRGTTHLLASAPSVYLAVGTAPLGIDDVTCGSYSVTWIDLDAAAILEHGDAVLDGGEESLVPPSGSSRRVALLLRRTSL